MRLTRDAILAADDHKTEVVQVPEWGGEVVVRGLRGRERDEFEASIVERRGRQMVPNTANIRAKLVVLCCVDDDGKPLFNKTDVEQLGEKSGAPIDRIYEVAAKLSGMTDEDMNELVEDFTPASGEGSSSPSQNGSASQSRNSSTESAPEN
jgi:hypothetical protein